MRKEKSRSPPKRSNGRFPLILACLPTTCKNTDSQGCVSIYEVLPKSWTKVMRQSHFEFCIGQDLTHSIFL